MPDSTVTSNIMYSSILYQNLFQEQETSEQKKQHSLRSYCNLKIGENFSRKLKTWTNLPTDTTTKFERFTKSNEKRKKKRRRKIWKMKRMIRTAEGVVCHTEEIEAVDSENMEDVAILREAEPGIGLRRKLLEDPASHGSRIPRHGAELRQHHRPPSHHRIQNRHRRARWDCKKKRLLFLSPLSLYFDRPRWSLMEMEAFFFFFFLVVGDGGYVLVILFK